MKFHSNHIHRTFLLLLLLTGCSWEEVPHFPEEPSSSSMVAEHSDDTRTGDKQNTADSCLSCYLQLTGRVIVDGGQAVDLSQTCVTVKGVEVGVTRGKIARVTTVYHPVIRKEVAEPDSVSYWNEMPLGVGYAPARLLEQPLLIAYEDSCDINVTVHYLLRTKDYDAVCKCVPDRYDYSFPVSLIGLREEKVNIDVPVRLSTIQLNAVVKGAQRE